MHMGLAVLGGAQHAQGQAMEDGGAPGDRVVRPVGKMADERGQGARHQAVEPRGAPGEASEIALAPPQQVEQLRLAQMGEQVEVDDVAGLEPARQVEGGDARDAVGPKEDLAVLKGDGGPIAHEGEHALDAQPVEVLEGQRGGVGFARAFGRESAGDGAEHGLLLKVGDPKDLADRIGLPARGDDDPAGAKRALGARRGGERLARVADMGLGVSTRLERERRGGRVQGELPAVRI